MTARYLFPPKHHFSGNKTADDTGVVPTRKIFTRRYFLILASLFLLVSINPVIAQDETPANRYGVVEGFWLPYDVCEMGAGWERIIFDWAQHQPTGPDDWHTLNVDDRWLANARDCNREVVAVFKHTPDWATDGLPGPGVPSGLYLPVDDPGNYWANFVRKTAEYYEPRGVSRFIIWNEPDITRETYGFEFEGTLDDYFQMLKVGYLALKQGNPEAEILLAGTTYWHDVNAGRRLYVDRLLERIMADEDAAVNGYYFDIVSLHIYFRAETVYDIVRATRDVLDKYGLQEKRIWITETNAGPTDDPLWPVVRPQYQINLAQQSAFLVQSAALGLAGGAERIQAYKFYDWNLAPGEETFGLVRADGSRRPGFYTWAMVIEHLSDVESAEYAQSASVDVVRFTHADGRQTIAAWARTGNGAQIQVEAQEGLLIDQYGNELMPIRVEGVFILSLPGARCDRADGCAVGGNVSLLVVPPGEITLQEIKSGQATDLAFE